MGKRIKKHIKQKTKAKSKQETEKQEFGMFCEPKTKKKKENMSWVWPWLCVPRKVTRVFKQTNQRKTLTNDYNRSSISDAGVFFVISFLAEILLPRRCPVLCVMLFVYPVTHAHLQPLRYDGNSISY